MIAAKDNVLVDVSNKLPCRQKADPNAWKRNVRKAMKALGEEYVNANGKIMEAKIPRLMENCGCHFK